MARKIKVGKIDLDTVGAAFLLGATRADEVEVLRSGKATPEDLANPEVICIEVGGSGQTQLNNWDHHDEGGPTASATRQVLVVENLLAELKDFLLDKPSEKFREPFDLWSSFLEEAAEEREKEYIEAGFRLVAYIDQLDTKGPRSLASYGQVGFPTLSDVFSGMLLTTKDSVEQLHKGVELLIAVMDSKQDSYGTIKGFDSYAEAKAENNRQIAKAVEMARWDTTLAGLKLGALETEFFGAPGALYGAGAQVVVCLNPNLNGVRKFTIAGNDIKIDVVKPVLNKRESGWGGPPTGTIIGSPREGSNLSLEEVAEIVKTTL